MADDTKDVTTPASAPVVVDLESEKRVAYLEGYRSGTHDLLMMILSAFIAIILVKRFGGLT